MDASKAFDRVNHCKLFDKLIDRGIPLIVVRLLYVWYSTQEFFVKWGHTFSASFTVSNGVRQGGILSPTLFNIYIDELSKILSLFKYTGCNLNGVSINHLVYADDTVVFAPSPSALQELIDCCEKFAIDHDILYNVKKTKILCIKPKRLKDLHVPNFTLNGRYLCYVSTEKYLGYMVRDNFMDDTDIGRQLRAIYSRGNSLIRHFKCCTNEVKLQLFKSYCSNLYCGQLWCNYKSRSFSKIKVAYNNVFRSLMCLKRDTSISKCMIDNNVDPFVVLRRKLVYGFRERVMSSRNKLVQAVTQSLFFVTSTINIAWCKVLYNFT